MAWVLLAQFMFALPAFAEERHDASEVPSLVLAHQDRASNATPYIGYFIDRDDELSIEDMTAPTAAHPFVPVQKTEANFGFEKAPIWLRMTMHNADETTLERILVMRTNFVSEISVWHQQSGMVTQVLEQELISPFSSRPIDYHQLATALQLEAGQSSIVWIRYRTTGITAMPISVETNMSFTTRSNREMARNFAFYGVMVVLIFASILALVITRAQIFLWYLLYSGFVTLYIFHRDGYAFQLFWRDFGIWNSYASLPLAGLLTIFAAQFTRAYLETHKNIPRLDLVLIGVIVFQGSSIAASALFDGEPIKQMMTVSIPISAIIFLTAGLIGLARKGVSVLAFVLGWTGIVAASAVTFIAHWIDLEVTRAATLDTMRTAMVFDALMMGIACFNVVMEWRREREDLMQDRLAAAERNASLRSRLGLVEQRFAAAQEAAENSSKLVANTTHDLRQPLFALRSSILKMASDPKTEASEFHQAEASLAYMEALVEKSLLQAMEGRTGESPSVSDTPVQRLLDTVSAIFAEDAEKAGIDLKVTPSEAVLDKGTGDILRILSNLISNAIAYSGAKHITLSVRQTNDAFVFEVTDDGCGMDDVLMTKVSQRAERGSEAAGQNPDGQGLGLAIVAELAKKLGGTWRLESATEQGTRAMLSVPVICGRS